MSRRQTLRRHGPHGGGRRRCWWCYVLGKQGSQPLLTVSSCKAGFSCRLRLVLGRSLCCRLAPPLVPIYYILRARATTAQHVATTSGGRAVIAVDGGTALPAPGALPHAGVLRCRPFCQTNTDRLTVAAWIYGSTSYGMDSYATPLQLATANSNTCGNCCWCQQRTATPRLRDATAAIARGAQRLALR